jgi:hypothetical protein
MFDAVMRAAEFVALGFALAAGIAALFARRQAKEHLVATIRERETQAAAEIAAEYQRVVESLPLVVYADALDEVSSAIFLSPQIEGMLGYTVQQWLARRTCSCGCCIRTIASAYSRRWREGSARTSVSCRSTG